ncbi:MAG: HNH endonuclease [Deltaproteobacteria bacterium]|nr:HNH endonuclease [Deltaproteobacteria bacterium]
MRKLQAHYAVTHVGDEQDPRDASREYYYWSGWTRWLWPAQILRPGLKFYAFDVTQRKLWGLFEVTHGGAFEYASKQEYATHVKRLTGWTPDRAEPKWQSIPVSGIGITMRWKHLAKSNISLGGRFPRTGWLRLDEVPAPTLDLADITFPEGDRQLKQHTKIERNPSARQAAMTFWRKKMGGKLACIACRFNFERRYGQRGADFVEIHHQRPLARSGRVATSAEKDLVPVCSNCHRMIHRYRDEWLSIVELRRILRS